MSEGNLNRSDVRVAASLVRCPFCHDDVDARATGWVACRSCLARHHAGCWSEHGACSSCGGAHSLSDRSRSAASLASTPGAPVRRSRAARQLLLLSPLVALGTFVVSNVVAFQRAAALASPTPEDLQAGKLESLGAALLAGGLVILAAIVVQRRAAKAD